MKISVITVTYNSCNTILDTIRSVVAQDYPSVEYIVVDGNSKDSTVEIIQQHSSAISMWVSEPDFGLYDAINKGIRMSTGDIVGILNSDDYFYDQHVLSRIAKAFETDVNLEATIGDIVFVKNTIGDQVIRRYSARSWNPSMFARGYMPPHPSFFVRRVLFEKLGFYRTDYKIAADYELLIRFLLNNKINWKYLPLITTKMRMGGASTKGIKSLITLNQEIYRACRENGVYTNYAMIYSKYLFKPFEFIFK